MVDDDRPALGPRPLVPQASGHAEMVVIGQLGLNVDAAPVDEPPRRAGGTRGGAFPAAGRDRARLRIRHRMISWLVVAHTMLLIVEGGRDDALHDLFDGDGPGPALSPSPV